MTMHTIFATERFTIFMSLVLLLGLSCFMTGCETATNSNSAWQQSRNSANADYFNEGASRPPTGKTLYTMATILSSQGRNEEAEYVLKRINNEFPQYLPAYQELAQIYMREQRTHDAIDVLSAGLSIKPDDAPMLNNMGMCYILLDNYDMAFDYFTQAANAMPNDARYHANRAVAMGMQRRYDEALDLFKNVVPLSDAYYNIGVLAQANNDLDMAAKSFRIADDLMQGKTATTQ